MFGKKSRPPASAPAPGRACYGRPVSERTKPEEPEPVESLEERMDLAGRRICILERWSLEPLEALRYRAVRRYNWTPAQVRELSNEDLALALHEEMERLCSDGWQTGMWMEF